MLAPQLKSVRSPPDYVEEYRQEYGYLGGALHAAVVKARQQPSLPTPSAASSASSASAVATSVAIAQARTQPSILQTSKSQVIQNLNTVNFNVCILLLL